MLVLAGLIDVKVFILKNLVWGVVGQHPTCQVFYVHEVLILPHQQFHNQADNSV